MPMEPDCEGTDAFHALPLDRSVRRARSAASQGTSEAMRSTRVERSDHRQEEQMRVITSALECIKTKLGEQTEEVYLGVYVDDESHPAYVLGPYNMTNGGCTALGPRAYDGGTISLLFKDEDPTGCQCIGGLRFVVSPSPGPERPPRASGRSMGLVGYDIPATHAGNDRHYRLYVDVQTHAPYVPVSDRNRLELLSLHCGNAQQWKDYVYINVNGCRLFGPRRMRSGFVAEMPEGTGMSFGCEAWLSLWEQDPGRDDLFGTLRIRVPLIGYSHFDEEQTHTFHAHVDSLDATYTLTYRVTEREPG